MGPGLQGAVGDPGAKDVSGAAPDRSAERNRADFQEERQGSETAASQA